MIRSAALLAAAAVLAAGCASARPEGPVARPVVEEYRLDAGDGTALAFDLRGTKGPVVVLIHGWRCDRALWSWTADDLARDHRVICLDLAGHGASGANHAEWTVATLAADVQAVLDALRVERAILVGHSMGGPVSLAAAARMPGRIAAVVGIDTLHDAEARWTREQFDPVIAKMEADPRKALGEFLPGMLAPGCDPALMGWIIERGMLADHRAASGLMRDFLEWDVPALMKGAGVPVRCLNAAPGGAPFCGPTATETNRKYADFDVVLMEGVGHYPMVERPVSFNAKLRELLAGIR